jgi:predicted RNA-binding Zn-ribbon protein involved in translation (DUF1610 family)
MSGNSAAKSRELGKFYLLYRCPGCGETGLSEHTLRRRKEGHGFFDYLDTRVTVSGTGLPTADNSGTGEREQALAGARKKLEAGDFSLVEEKVPCPRCGAVQPWSGMGQPWLTSPLALITAVVAFITLWAMRLIGGQPEIRHLMLPALIPLGITVLLSIGRTVRRRRRLAAAKRDTAGRPGFFAPEDLRTLSPGPQAELAKRYLRRG